MTMNQSPQNRKFVTVETQDQLQSTVSALSDGEVLAFDTEFIREKTYYPWMCLLQLANESHTACIDVLKCGNIDAIWDLLMDPQRIKIVHSARQDLELILHEHNQLPGPLFDTQIAAAINGHGLQISYGGLVEEELDVRLDKAHTRTDWSRRPLSGEQLEYAADDVRYLVPLYHKQYAQLAAQRRLDWVQQESATLLDESLYRVHPVHAWRKIKGAGKLYGKTLATARSLAAWREEYAMRADRPRRWIMSDKTLISLAKDRPDTLDALRHIPGMEPRQIERRGAQLIAAIRQTTVDSRVEEPQDKGGLDAGQRQIVKKLALVVDQCAEDLRVSREILATRRDLEQLVRSGKCDRLLAGWRSDVIGNKLLAAMQTRD